jgi:hypothetical protein
MFSEHSDTDVRSAALNLGLSISCIESFTVVFSPMIYGTSNFDILPFWLTPANAVCMYILYFTAYWL